MADQASLKRFDIGTANGTSTSRVNSGQASPDPGTGGMVSNVAGFGENLLALAELQARLTAVEMRQNLASVKTGGALLAGSVLLGLCTVPIFMIALAELLVSELGVKRGYALLSAATVGLVIAGVCGAIAGKWLRNGRLGFPLSGEEFARNVNWLRTILRHSGRWPLGR